MILRTLCLALPFQLPIQQYPCWDFLLLLFYFWSQSPYQQIEFYTNLLSLLSLFTISHAPPKKLKQNLSQVNFNWYLIDNCERKRFKKLFKINHVWKFLQHHIYHKLNLPQFTWDDFKDLFLLHQSQHAFLLDQPHIFIYLY